MPSLMVATNAHIDGVLALQAENLLKHMAPQDQASGFVTTPFTPEQLDELIAGRGLFVAADDSDHVLAYVVCASWQYLSAWPIFVYMVSLFDEFTYLDDTMTVDNSYQYGPICIDSRYRGTELLPEIFAFAREHMAQRYPYALTFVNKKNERSYHAHIRKLGLDHVRDFEFSDNSFYMLGFPT